MASKDEATEVPDQTEDPEGYAQHVQDVREEDAELQEQVDAIAAKRGNLPPQMTDEEREELQKATAKAQADQAKEAEKAEKANA